MRVFMCGWEFPPFISGGLGTACFGLTKALSRRSVEVVFVLPRAVDVDAPLHLKLLSPPPESGAAGEGAGEGPGAGGALGRAAMALAPPQGHEEAFANVRFVGVPSQMTSPYAAPAQGHGPRQATAHDPAPAADLDVIADPAQAQARTRSLGRGSERNGAPHRSTSVLRGPEPQGPAPYAGDLLAEAQRYARVCADLARHESFDVVHAHDWLTFPAGLAVAAITGRPMVAHVHSTEFDRSGEHVNQQVYDIERRGLHGAMHVIAVSHYTKNILVHRYGLSPERVTVVYNGIESEHSQPLGSRSSIAKRDKIVLFLGRMTMQKGPEYFVSAARKVLEVMDNVKFVMAGTGDKVQEIIELAAEQGIGHKVLFTGFLHGRDVERIFQMADLYVMPSVSEPFGIAPLEAISHDVPVIISRTSGVSEVLTHALKVDFWDTREIANKIVAVLRHPPLALTLREHADVELHGLTWDDAARRCEDVYEAAVGAMPQA